MYQPRDNRDPADKPERPEKKRNGSAKKAQEKQ